MKVTNPNTQTNAPSTGQTQQEVRRRADNDRSEEDGGKRFGSAMEKKAAEKKMPSSPQAVESGVAAPQLFLQQVQASSERTAEVSSPGLVSAPLPPEISALSGEILRALEVTGPNEVHIQFDAAVLDGLSVTLTKEGGALQVALQTASPEVARFLEVHAATLAQTLERPDRGAYITVQTRTGDDRQQRHSGGGQGGRDGQDRENQQNTGGDVQ